MSTRHTELEKDCYQIPAVALPAIARTVEIEGTKERRAFRPMEKTVFAEEIRQAMRAMSRRFDRRVAMKKLSPVSHFEVQIGRMR